MAENVSISKKSNYYLNIESHSEFISESHNVKLKQVQFDKHITFYLQQQLQSLLLEVCWYNVPELP
jgi:hypothetical protein